MTATEDRPNVVKIDPEKAFIHSDKHALGDLALKPWTPERIIAAQNMGMLYPHIGDEGWDQFHRTGVYAGCVKDITICLWLCTLPEVGPIEPGEKIMSVLDADRSPVKAYAEARQWAIGKGIIKPNSDEFWDAYRHFSEIVKEVSDSETQPVEKEEGAEDPNE
jgi:hypothetical protein